MLKAGDPAPDFTLPADDGSSLGFHEYVATGPVVLYFYPADFTPVCTKQACMMRDWREPLIEAGYRVIGVSPQSEESHQRFDRKHTLGFTLLADADRSVCRAYGALGPLGLIVRRATFLVDADAVVRDRVVADFRVGRHRGFVEKLLGSPD